MKQKYGPINAATPTPLMPDGSLDQNSAKKLCKRWLDVKLDGVFLLGSMGEGPYLSDAARNAFVEIALEEVGDRLTVMACAGDVSRTRMMERALRYADLGAHCVVLFLPPKIPAQKAIADVLTVADACPVPCAYYDIPANTGTPLVVDEILSILSHENIHVLKDSSGNALIQQGLTSERRPADCLLWDGNEYHAVFTHLAGYDGVLHGGAALTGLWVRKIWELMEEGRYQEAEDLDRKKALFLARIYNRFSRPLQNTIGQKHALKLLGYLDHEAVVTDQSLDDGSRERIQAAVEEHRDWLV